MFYDGVANDADYKFFLWRWNGIRQEVNAYIREFLSENIVRKVLAD